MPDSVDAAILLEDLSAPLRNILENATKWAQRVVSVSVSRNSDIRITTEDDGPGVPAGQLDKLGGRGVRLDEQKQGSGLGLAIACDVTEAYGGMLSFNGSPLGGLAVTVRIPRPPPAN